MRYLGTAFQQLEFAWKLYNYALEGKFDIGELDKPITFQSEDQSSIFVLQDQLFQSPDDLIIALENNLTITFGAAAITLNRTREEMGIPLPNPIESEQDQCVSLIYQIRNAFAHDISEPKWNINNQRYARIYTFGDLSINLSNVSNKVFEYSDIGGPEFLRIIKDYAEFELWP
ncbi:MAG: hypothetical protein KZQ90_14755 [Candidatus Thiodiazotropha sp. (ex Codakia rugifera)]|nr:hypothetical protein [Candidatus Thiodiazotropha sp. (ex Codakia rugifera)]